MSRGMVNRNKKNESDEVEELLRAAEDDVFLKLNLNSHMARGSSSTQSINPDLDQRFQALRSKQTPPKNPKSQQGLDNKPPPSASTSLTTDSAMDSDDLFTRFAALKSSLPAYSSVSSSGKQQTVVDNEEDDDDDEVEKVIKWAIDAARLDPSPPSGTDDDDDDVDDNSSSDEDEDENSENDFKRGKRKTKRKSL